MLAARDKERGQGPSYHLEKEEYTCWLLEVRKGAETLKHLEEEYLLIAGC